MLSANQIPEYSSPSTSEACNWWKRMIELGFSINPDDDPADCLDSETASASFDETACGKIRGIYQRMFDNFGEDTYTLAQTAYMDWMGYKVNSIATPENCQDFWISTVQ